jgi:hypothetical protein
MKTSGWFMKGSFSLAIFIVLLLISCHQNDFTSALLAHIQSEAVSDSYQSETVDLSTVAVNNTTETLSGGRYGASSREVKGLGDIDDRFKSATVTHTKDPVSTAEKPVGKITIDFGAGCTDARGKTRKGMIIISYAGKRFTPGSVMKVTVKDFYKNDAKVEGTITLTNISPSQQDYPKFQIVESGKMTFPDGRIATREQTLVREWQRADNPSNDKWVTDGGSSGINKNGKNYEMKITSSLIHSRACEINNKTFIPVKGIKTLTVDGKVIIIDYGDGSCDNSITVTVNGKSKVETLTDAGK